MKPKPFWISPWWLDAVLLIKMLPFMLAHGPNYKVKVDAR